MKYKICLKHASKRKMNDEHVSHPQLHKDKKKLHISLLITKFLNVISTLNHVCDVINKGKLHFRCYGGASVNIKTNVP